MEKNTCKLCFRSFPSGRALGGHMRSHVATAKIHKESSSSSSTSSHYDDDEDGGPAIGYGLRENPKRSFRLVDPEFSPTVDAGSSAIVQDRDSETETSPASIHRRGSKRKPEPASSVSDTATEEEDVAISLMMLSRDTWKNHEGPTAAIKKHQAKERTKYQCGTCKKVFRSYQALGGHRASHKKFKSCVPPPKRLEPTTSDADAEIGADHTCSVCSRSFPSGQALGGHKRSHFASAQPLNVAKFSIDLNMPAPTEEEEEEEEADQMSAVLDEVN